MVMLVLLGVVLKLSIQTEIVATKVLSHTGVNILNPATFYKACTH